MSLNLIQINPLVSSQWDEAVLRSSSPQFFHLSCWIRTLVETYNFKPLCFMFPQEYGCTIPILIVKTLSGKKKAVALPFTDECDLNCNGHNHDELVSMLLDLTNSENVNRLEFRGVTGFKPSGEPSHSYYGHRLQLTKDSKKLWKALSSSKQRNIKKAQKENVLITFDQKLASIREFYRLHCITRKRHGLPTQPVRFFDAIYNNIVEKGFGEIALARSNNCTVAGAIFLFSKLEVLFKYGASDKNLQYIRSNDLLMWQAIERYAQKGWNTLFFGKTEKFHEGLCRFKEGFGAVRFIMNDYYYNDRGYRIKDEPKLNGIHNILFRNMPISMLRLCGEFLYKFSA